MGCIGSLSLIEMCFLSISLQKVFYMGLICTVYLLPFIIFSFFISLYPYVCITTL